MEVEASPKLCGTVSAVCGHGQRRPSKQLPHSPKHSHYSDGLACFLPVSSVLTQPSVDALEKLRRAMRRAPDGRFPPRIDHALPMSGMILSTRGRDGRLRSSPVRPSFPLIRHDIDPFSYCILPLTLSNIVPLTIAVHISNPTTALPTTHLRIGQRCQILRPGSSE